MPAAAPILTLTLNPALDLSTSAAQVRPGEKLRCAEPTANAGGGGLNVARALHRLGAPSVALVALGGLTGDRLADLLRAEGIAFLALKSPGETRQSMTVTEETTGAQYRFLLPGPHWSVADQRQVFALLAATARAGSIAVISGSQPPGVPRDFAAQLAASMPESRVVLDTSGTALVQAVSHPIPGLEVLRMDGEEAEGLAGRSLASRAETADFAQELVRRGVARMVVVARGADGNVLADAERRLFAKAPKVTLKSAVGAGDSFVAAFVLGLARGEGPGRALAFGSASAAAAVITDATQLCRAEDVLRLLPQAEVSEV